MEVKDKVKRRRLERLRYLRESGDHGYKADAGSKQLDREFSRKSPEPPIYADAEWVRHMEDPEFAWRYKYKMDPSLNGSAMDLDEDGGNNLAPPWRRRFLVKLFISCVLFAAVWGLFQSKQPWADKGKQFVVAALTEPLDTSAISAWYDQRFGGSPSFIPSFHGSGDEAVKASTSKRTLFVPVHGSILTPYDASSHGGVMLQTELDAPVYALDTGQVVFAGPKEDTGFTIVIRHPGGLESTYGWVSEAHVELHDWIKAGEAVGKAGTGDHAKGTLYFAVTKDGHPIDPLDVISFD